MTDDRTNSERRRDGDLEHGAPGYITHLDGRPISGLPVAGYKPTQPPEAIAAVNVFKELEERALRHVEAVQSDSTIDPDQRFLAIGKTQLQQAFMALNRAIFQPGRVSLPEDEKRDGSGLDV